MRRVEIIYEDWSAVVEIDDTKKPLESMKLQLLFWSIGQDLIDYEHGDIESAYLKLLGSELIKLSNNCWIDSLKRHFEDKEGWSPLNGENGVTLKECEDLEYDSRDFELSEI